VVVLKTYVKLRRRRGKAKKEKRGEAQKKKLLLHKPCYWRGESAKWAPDRETIRRVGAHQTKKGRVYLLGGLLPEKRGPSRLRLRMKTRGFCHRWGKTEVVVKRRLVFSRGKITFKRESAGQRKGDCACPTKSCIREGRSKHPGPKKRKTNTFSQLELYPATRIRV